MADRCPLCGQALPQGVTEHQLHTKMEELSIPALNEERKRLQKEFQEKLVAEREMGRQRAEREFKREKLELQQKVDQAQRSKDEALEKMQKDLERKLQSEREKGEKDAEKRMKSQVEASARQVEELRRQQKRELEEARKDAERRSQEEMKKSMRLALQENELHLRKAQQDKEKERLQHEADKMKMQIQLENLTRKLQNQTSQQLGDEAEIDLEAELNAAFPDDKIERIGKGVRGADLVQRVMENNKELGRIVYESKNSKTWSSAYITQAKKYQSLYESPYVVIVSRVFPAREREMCVVSEIPIVSPRMVTSLASIMREAVCAVGKLRLSGQGSDEKAQELFGYITSDDFSTKFNDIADGAKSLRDHQSKERTWHEKAWNDQTKLHEMLESRHRIISAKLDTVLHSKPQKKPMSVAARA